MHSGFPNLRNDAPMNIRRRTDAGRMTADGLGDAARVDELWREWLARSGGPFLFGQWSIADAMYAPVVTRFVTYAIPASDGGAGLYRPDGAEPHMAAWMGRPRRKRGSCRGRIRLRALTIDSKSH